MLFLLTWRGQSQQSRGEHRSHEGQSHNTIFIDDITCKGQILHVAVTVSRDTMRNNEIAIARTTAAGSEHSANGSIIPVNTNRS